MIHPKTAPIGTSKISKLPKLLSYPKLITSLDYIKGLFCYVVRHYSGNDGLAVLIYRVPKQDDIAIMCGDWNGNLLDLESNSPLVPTALKFLQTQSIKLLELMRYAKIEQAQYFFSVQDNDLVLVDVQISLNKFFGPGMLNDIMGKVIKTQQILKIEVIDERALEYITKNTGSYDGNLVLKPSKFRMCEINNKWGPLYVEVIR